MNYYSLKFEIFLSASKFLAVLITTSLFENQSTSCEATIMNCKHFQFSTAAFKCSCSGKLLSDFF